MDDKLNYYDLPYELIYPIDHNAAIEEFTNRFGHENMVFIYGSMMESVSVGHYDYFPKAIERELLACGYERVTFDNYEYRVKNHLALGYVVSLAPKFDGNNFYFYFDRKKMIITYADDIDYE